ncbi:FidL-like putative membrane protein [Serratia fonticola]|uniref:FidL-like putative membrane protein n=1 Tax=Serratia fonticola TaxID=47917 RepID=A0A542BJ23_SERFO|nr:FidL-like protein [Serratia fonticola]TQI78572.1 FidL-like putative membrane protein [Serratia fonticola]TQI99405.1 FidL-like putative membrane protein [Serratia fonticola]TVZ68930.1 FidL-like putative membrane protein [Serratia fonticola]
MKKIGWGRGLFTLSILLLLISLFVAFKRDTLWPEDILNCSTKAIMHFEDTVTESVNVNIHFSFNDKGKGSIVVEGYSDSTAGWLYLQRYVQFNYTSKRISPSTRYYQINRWVASKSSIDQSPDVIFDYFMREMSDSHDGLLLAMEKIDQNTVLLSSINSPLYICTLKPGSQLN